MAHTRRRKRCWPRGKKRLALHRYQQDAIRLLIRNFRRPKEIPPEVWEGLVRGQLPRVAGKHLDRISEMAPQLCQALDFWDGSNGLN